MPGLGNLGVYKHPNTLKHKHRQTDTPTHIYTHTQKQTNEDRHTDTHSRTHTTAYMTDKGERKLGEDMALVNGFPTKVMPGSGNTGVMKHTNAHTD